MTRAVQYFSDESLIRGMNLKPEQVVEFIESFQALHVNAARAQAGSKLISMKVNRGLLEAFRLKCQVEGVRYQTQIKFLMEQWLGGFEPAPRSEPIENGEEIAEIAES